jgi:predicted SAM-dependent methyltransferase
MVTATEDARAEVENYLRFAAERQTQQNSGEHGDRLLRRSVRVLIPQQLRGRARIWLTDLQRPAQRRRAQGFTSQPLRLHLGCGRKTLHDWVNVDLSGDRVDLAWNLARPLPFRDGSAEAIFHEHVLEHLSLEQSLKLLEECHRLLRPGGILRIVVPDAGGLARSYANGGSDMLERVRPGRPSAMLALQEMFYWHRHCTMYDAETLKLVVTAAGFSTVEESSFGQSRLTPPPDSDDKRDESLYVEAVR